jgi:hypothetical protein
MNIFSKDFYGLSALLNDYTESSPSKTRGLFKQYWRGQSLHLDERLDFCFSDKLAQYKKNCSKDSSFKAYWESPENKISYDFNPYGLRVENDRAVISQENKNAIFIGCSHTFGLGVPWGNTWVAQIAAHLECIPINLGVNGGSLDTCFRLFYLWQRFLKADHAFLLIPPWPRFEKITRTDAQLELFDDIDIDDVIIKNMAHNNVAENDETSFLMHPYHMINQKLKNIHAIKEIAASTGCSLYILDCNDFKDMTSKKYKGDEVSGFRLARDNMHGGPGWHCEVTDAFKKLIQANQ